jgi:hypothetical protein
MSDYKMEIQQYLPADELRGNSAFLVDQPDEPNKVTEIPGVSRKATMALVAGFMAASADNAAAINGILAPVAAGINGDISAERTARQNAVADLQAQIDLGQGRGGALAAHDFGVPSAELGQPDLIEYACEDIWGAGGVFAFDPDVPADSAYIINGETHTAGEMFNNVWVRNTNGNENHKWVLTNTPDTVPAVYEWADVGQDVVGDATPDFAGVAKLYSDYAGNNTDGSVTQAQIAVMYGILVNALATKFSNGGGNLTGPLIAAQNPDNTAQARNITVSSTLLTPGSSALATGEIYICYE